MHLMALVLAILSVLAIAIFRVMRQTHPIHLPQNNTAAQAPETREAQTMSNPIEPDDFDPMAPVIEAERILYETTAEGRVSAYLRDQSRWPGSSVSIMHDATGFVGALVTVYTDNPVKLQMLLSWLGVPKSVSGPAVGMER